MKITELGHLALTCRDLDASLSFYRDILGLKEKFCLYYDDIGQTVSGDRRWIVYMQVDDRTFIELFNGDYNAPPLCGQPLGFQHLALIVEDIMALRDELAAKGAPIDAEPSLGCDQTWQMWSHDPDGNKIEFMQYTDRSFQKVGRN